MRTDLDALLEAFIELNKLSAAPGEKCHMLADSLDFLKKQIKVELESKRLVECITNG